MGCISQRLLALVCRMQDFLVNGGMALGINSRMPESETRAPSKGHLNVIERLENICKRFRQLRLAKVDSHAKLLLIDSTFAVIGSFNWLSFHGDPDRPFRDEQSVLVTLPNMIERKFQDLRTWFVDS
jgi:phosphatidylserine/phosphatidylglycerophosphate/cardiolipin synthase-like enzyme